MMFKKVCTVLLMISILSTFLFSSSVCGADEKKKVMLVYDIKKIFDAKEDSTNVLYNLIHHFSVTVDMVGLDEYKKGAVEAYDYVFVCFYEKNAYYKQDFFEDIEAYKGEIIWIGEKVDRFVRGNYPQFRYVGKKTNLLEVEYNGQNYKIPNELNYNIIMPVSETIGEDVKVVATLLDGASKYPYILEMGKFRYVARLEVDYGPLYYIFSDYLYNIFDVESTGINKVFVRIEDIHPLREPETLREIADYLYSQKVPFMIALIPAYLNPESREYITISDKPAFAEAVRYMVEKGGSIILHGYSHQYYNSESGEGFEFWDAKTDAPLKEDTAQWIEERVSLGVKECLRNGIYPLAFEPPHYAMNQEGYVELKKYFSTVVAHYQSSDIGFTSSTFPYEIRGSKYFNLLIPENMGFVELDLEEKSVKDIVEKAEELRIVRGYTGGFFFHPYMDIKYLKQIVEGLKERDFAFFALTDIENWVKIHDIHIYNEGEKAVSRSVVTETGLGYKKVVNKQLEKPTLYLAIFVLLIVLSLVIIFLWYRWRTTKAMFEMKQHF